MHIMDGKIILSDLAKRLGVTSQSLRNHMKNESGLGEGAVKFGDNQTGGILLPIDSVLNYLNWSMSHSKKLDFGLLEEVTKEVEALKND
jgi:hypothetical protein